MIARLAAILLAVLFLSGCGVAEKEPRRDWPAPSPAIWEASRDGGAVVWLFGTVHALPDGLAWRTPALEEALARSDLLVVEIAALEDAREAGRAFEAAAPAPGLPPLGARVAAADRPRLAALLARAGMEESDFAGQETWAAALALAAATRAHDPANGVDRALLADARSVEGLETHAAQFARFDGLSPRAQAELLLAVADDALDPDREALVEAWLTGDVARLVTLSAGRLLYDRELRAALVTARNRAWAARIEALSATGARPFVAVGAGHLLGADGLPALLAARGFAVRRVQ